MIPAVIALAAQIGAPLLRGILTRKIGQANSDLVTGVIGQIATRAGARPEDLAKMADENPGRVIDAIREVEAMAPEMIALYDAAQTRQIDLMRAEMAAGGPLWSWAWRPAGMWGLGALWFWNLIVLHVANAIFKTALPPTDLGMLFQLTALYMGLYMGGHTVKDIAQKWTGNK